MTAHRTAHTTTCRKSRLRDATIIAGDNVAAAARAARRSTARARNHSATTVNPTLTKNEAMRFNRARSVLKL
jgi:hypothetical protein